MLPRPGALPQQAISITQSLLGCHQSSSETHSQRGLVPWSGCRLPEPSTYCCPTCSPLPFDLSLSSHRKDPQGGSRVTCRSVTPSHLGEQKADPPPIVPTEGNKSKLCTAGQSRKGSPQGPDSANLGYSVSTETQWFSASQYLAPAGFIPVPLLNLLHCPRPCLHSHGPGTTTRPHKKTKNRLGGGLLNTILSFCGIEVGVT